jgi:hypothetical protein
LRNSHLATGYIALPRASASRRRDRFATGGWVRS